MQAMEARRLQRVLSKKKEKDKDEEILKIRAVYCTIWGSISRILSS